VHIVLTVKHTKHEQSWEKHIAVLSQEPALHQILSVECHSCTTDHVVRLFFDSSN